jgi:glycosyltransferase involved in cell wall biosynthesis
MARSTRTGDRSQVQRKYGIADDAFVIASFGYIAPTKLNHLVCEAVKELSRTLNRDLYYLMVGEGGYVDRELGRTIIKTGYVPQEEYDAILDRCDIVANLRYPSMGETSISLIHAMGMGKPCLVTDHAWFAELPDDAVIKIAGEQCRESLLQQLTALIASAEQRQAIGKAARLYVESNHALGQIATDLAAVLTAKA